MPEELKMEDRITKIEFRQEATEKAIKHISDSVDTLVQKFTDTPKPTSWKDIIATIGATMVVISMLVATVYSIVDFKTAVPVEQGRTTAKKVDEIIDEQNKLVNVVALMSAELKALTQKVESNTGFVEEYIYKEKIPSVISGIQKDIEYLKERKKHGSR